MAIPDLSAYPGALDVFSVTVPAAWLGADTIASVSAGVETWALTPVPDANAATLLRGAPSISGSIVSAWVGGVSTTTNFVAGAVYTLCFYVVASSGRVLPAPVNISVAAVTLPAAASGGSFPPNEFSKTASFAPALAGTYYCNGTGIVVTIPSASVGGDILIVNDSATQNVTFTGVADNYSTLPTLTPGASFTLRWSTLKSKIVIV